MLRTFASTFPLRRSRGYLTFKVTGETLTASEITGPVSENAR